ncbi:uncharacterized protein LOC135207963 [Macrobrachium nipponense]|uniref:uncharacterized protein LOC135207963 n=1 Tax=Macrobrachium nipponense TaxID=159736 RepID=UPI0030C7BFB7
MEQLQSHAADQAQTPAIAGMSSYGEPTSDRKPLLTYETPFTAPDALLYSSLLSDSFLSQLSMDNSASMKELSLSEDSREVTRDFDEKLSQDSFLSYSEDMICKLMQESDFEDLLTAGSSGVDEPRSDPATELPPTNSFDARPHEMPVIIASMRGGHRCLATDSSRCAFTKYQFLPANENGHDEAMSTRLSFSQPGPCLPLSPLRTNDGPKSPRKMAVVATSDVARSSSRGKARTSRRKRTSLKHASRKAVAKQAAAAPSRSQAGEDCEPFKVTEGMKKPVDDSKVECNGCNATFCTIYNWHKHIQLKRCRETKERKTGGNIFCSGCGKPFKLLKYLFYHIALKRCKGKNKQE